MKTIKKNFAIIALLLGVGSAFASTQSKQADVLWGHQSDDTWQQVSSAYSCLESADICTRTYPAGQNPNVNANGYISQQDGTFSQ